MAALREARKGEAWWARRDSNPQPDRYERSALTIELHALPRVEVSEVRARENNKLVIPAKAGTQSSSR